MLLATSKIISPLKNGSGSVVKQIFKNLDGTTKTCTDVIKEGKVVKSITQTRGEGIHQTNITNFLDLPYGNAKAIEYTRLPLSSPNADLYGNNGFTLLKRSAEFNPMKGTNIGSPETKSLGYFA